MSNFDDAIIYVLGNEGGVSRDPKDPGGITKYGISLRFLEHLSHSKLYAFLIGEHKTDENDIENLTKEQAAEIYYGEFWNHEYEEIGNQKLCNYIFDMAINMGPANAHRILQRAVNIYEDNNNLLVNDGVFGKSTLDYTNKIGEALMPVLRSERICYYRLLVAEKPNQANELEGWINRSFS